MSAADCPDCRGTGGHQMLTAGIGHTRVCSTCQGRGKTADRPDPKRAEFIDRAIQSAQQYSAEVADKLGAALAASVAGEPAAAEALLREADDNLFTAGQTIDSALNGLTAPKWGGGDNDAPATPQAIDARLSAAELAAGYSAPRTDLSPEDRLTALEALVEQMRAAAHQADCNRILNENEDNSGSKVRRGP